MANGRPDSRSDSRMQDHTAPALRLWVAVLAPTAIWAAQFNLAYLIVTLYCEDVLAAAWPWLLLIGALALTADVAAGVVGFRGWQRARERRAQSNEAGFGEHQLSGLAAGVSAIVALAIILTTAGQLLVQPC